MNNTQDIPQPPASDYGASLFAGVTGSETLRWTAEKPKRRGWWWVSKGPHQFGVCVDVLLGVMTVYTPWVGCCPLSAFDAEWWAGPLPGPMEAPDEATSPNGPDQR